MHGPMSYRRFERARSLLSDLDINFVVTVFDPNSGLFIEDINCDNPPFGIKWSREQKSESRAELLGIKAIEGMLSFDHLRLNMDRRK